VSGQLHTPAALPPGKRLWNAVNKRLGGPHSRSTGNRTLVVARRDLTRSPGKARLEFHPDNGKLVTICHATRDHIPGYNASMVTAVRTLTFTN
jgi:hypothetical protein